MKKIKIRNRKGVEHRYAKHAVSTNAHKKGNLKLTVAKAKGGKKHRKGSHKTLLT
jgi:hypothetical protein